MEMSNMGSRVIKTKGPQKKVLFLYSDPVGWEWVNKANIPKKVKQLEEINRVYKIFVGIVGFSWNEYVDGMEKKLQDKIHNIIKSK